MKKTSRGILKTKKERSKNALHLTKKIIYKPTEQELNILNAFAFSSAKLWNIANYEKKNYIELGFSSFPNWYDQKKRLKDEFWYKNLPSQTAQDVLDKLQKSWKSFFELQKSKGIKNPKPPRFKEKNSLFNFTFLNNGFNKISKDTINFSIPKQQKEYLEDNFSFDSKYLSLKIKEFSAVTEKIKTIEFKPLKDKTYQINVVYEIEEAQLNKDNKHYLSIDIGIKNLFTCYDNEGKSFIASGTKYLEISHYFNKKIAHFQSIASKQQIASGKKYASTTKRIKNLQNKKRLQLHHFFHCATKEIASYCEKNDISKAVIGDIKNIRKNSNLGKVTNQKLHALPYEKLYSYLQYKLRTKGIELIKIKEIYSSQVSPFAPKVNKTYATKAKRKHRGLFIDNHVKFNADSVGAYNILRLYEEKQNKGLLMPIKGLSSPIRIKVAV